MLFQRRAAAAQRKTVRLERHGPSAESHIVPRFVVANCRFTLRRCVSQRLAVFRE